jgi:hypothetical protein
MRFKHNISSDLTNLLDLPINALKMGKLVDFSIGVACFIEEWRLIRTALHVAFVYH